MCFDMSVANTMSITILRIWEKNVMNSVIDEIDAGGEQCDLYRIWKSNVMVSTADAVSVSEYYFND